ncbi:oxygen-independent coproporphyrinogen III oxidase [Neisseria wadsworthii]|uniref:Coproporphyrinogen-III oxidase n=1 Tax=Neisseria wadsworthii 9715 TaxID=1030841 RepID=G4CPA0_9NEIS|nr:oxygen-independent coproporphyrinogen III oxidase [Neisseria wadsworthii]EGZ48194.1 oxygen-independent coproporphyrinogen III oxidase [Neisseria wadsworthii 9715]QMT34732.1 oxygen-independent coproporphyrinogen III oxidase [Neisseria wadsworthii]
MKIITIHNHTLPVFDRQLIASLPASGPRYTSYPTADRFDSSWSEQDYISALATKQENTPNKALSLYIHIPFCNTICYYCGCNKIITKDKARADTYIQYLERELGLLAPHLKGRRQLAQLHFGGGTPTFLNDDQIERVFAMISKHFTLIPTGEYSIEIDPRKVSRDTVFHLGKLGFNRMSVGIQDFDPKVQQAVNRIQTETETREVIEAAREAGFKSISVDLIYGLPQQSLKSIKPTIETVLSLDPDRLALYHYAHLPHIFKPQRRIDTDAVPDSEEKLDILQYAVQTLTARGYEFIGMDHFAKPTDELTIALHEGRLQRNFQGYSTHADCDLIAIGVSSIGKIGSIYAQNEKDIDAYYAALDANRLPIMRGYQLTQDDILRRQIIQDLMCRFSLDFSEYQEQFGIQFEEYFEQELQDLNQMAQLGLLHLDTGSLTVSPKGRFLIRNIAMIFDYHLRHRETKVRYSQTV